MLRLPRKYVLVLVTVFALRSVLPVGAEAQQPVPEMAWAIRYDPKTLDPAKVDEQASETVRYLTGGVLLRTNRVTQETEPYLASRWSVSPDGRTVTFHLREGLHFSDGSPLGSGDVAWSLKRVLAPATGAPVAEEFVDPAGVTVSNPDALTVVVHLSKRVVAIGKVFDEIAIEPVNRPSEGRVTSGPYVVTNYDRGRSLRLHRNPHYWKHDGSGAALPYVEAIRLDVLNNREQEQIRFLRGEYQLMESLPAENFGYVSQKSPQAAHDLGASLNTEQMWFNEAAGAPLPEHEKAWFQSTAFRTAVSQAMHRTDLARIAYGGHATPAYDFISPANAVWYNKDLHFAREDLSAATRLLASAGFHKNGEALFDAGGHRVRFSLVTNAGNRAREKMATLIQQDLSALGMEVNVVTLDFPALIERVMHTGNYEAALLGLSNVEPDPNAMMNLWLSSSPNHQWNPAEKTPATVWEAEIDTQMQTQATAVVAKERKRAVDRVQQIVADQQPFIYLVYPNSLYAVSPQLGNVQMSVLQPGVIWNIDTIRWNREAR